MAGVLIDETPILLFDEPLANLDPQTGYEAIQMIDQLYQSQNLQQSLSNTGWKKF